MNRIQKLRELIKKNNLAGYIIPTADPHQSEYVSSFHSRRSFLTGFTGSAGTGIVLAYEKIGFNNGTTSTPTSTTGSSSSGSGGEKLIPGAFLWTDGRYDLQAKQELSLDEWNVMIYPNPEPHYPEWFEKYGKNLSKWILDNIEKSNDSLKIGVDPTLITLREHRELSKKLENTGFSLELVPQNLVDIIWDQDQEDKRPSMPEEPIIVLQEKYSGRSVSDKLDALRKKMKENACEYLITGMLDEIAWIFNLRGSDISYNPVFLSYAVIGLDSVSLYVSSGKNGNRLNENGVLEHLKMNNIIMKSYDTFTDDLLNISGKIWISPDYTNMAVFSAISKQDSTIFEADSEIEKMKAIKNETEIEGFRQSNIRDGAAVCQFFAWLENELQNGNTSITEVSAADVLLEFRKKQDLFVSESFAPIIGYESNGAIIHYHAKKSSCKTLGTKGMLLVDSGAQFLDGTTDTTRTVHFGEPTNEEKDSFTRVLKGHIALDSLVFPYGVGGFQVDLVARQFLWKNGMDYAHGTGHLIGHFLNVHEGPASIGYRNRIRGLIPLEKGMVCSNEPGYYLAGKFGIRIENDLVVKLAKTDYRVNNVDYLGFEHFTLVPIQTKLIKKDMLTLEELKWVNDYNQEVFDKVGALLKDDTFTLNWLKKECKPL